MGASAGIALINSFGNLAGFAGPYLTGLFRDLTGSISTGLWIVAGFMVLSGVVVLSIARQANGAPAPAAPAQNKAS